MDAKSARETRPTVSFLKACSRVSDVPAPNCLKAFFVPPCSALLLASSNFRLSSSRS